jgi:hypothetical protein
MLLPCTYYALFRQVANEAAEFVRLSLNAIVKYNILESETTDYTCMQSSLGTKVLIFTSPRDAREIDTANREQFRTVRYLCHKRQERPMLSIPFNQTTSTVHSYLCSPTALWHHHQPRQHTPQSMSMIMVNIMYVEKW